VSCCNCCCELHILCCFALANGEIRQKFKVQSFKFQVSSFKSEVWSAVFIPIFKIRDSRLNTPLT